MQFSWCSQHAQLKTNIKIVRMSQLMWHSNVTLMWECKAWQMLQLNWVYRNYNVMYNVLKCYIWSHIGKKKKKKEWYLPAVEIIPVVLVIKFITTIRKTEGEEGTEKDRERENAMDYDKRSHFKPVKNKQIKHKLFRLKRTCSSWRLQPITG